jgi:hypothetical protein
MATRVPRESKFPPDKTAQQVIIELADTKNHAGSLIKITPDGKPIHYIIPNYWYAPYDKGIRIWRWLDAQHDFEKGLKKVANTVLRTHFGIGTRNADDEFLKYIDDPVAGRFVNNKTTSTKDVLHETVDFEELIPGLYDNKPLTVSYPDPTERTNQGFTHFLPTILPEINLADILAGENLLDKYPAGDLLIDIIVNDKLELEVATKLDKLRTYLGINQRDYSKDAANINTQVFVNLFRKNDLSFFKEILDPASEQSDIVNENVRITILFCYINGNTPIYITLEKRKGENDKSKRTWYYLFHTGQMNDTVKFHEWDFGKTTSGAHPCPSIETTVHYITKNVDGRTATAGLQAISNFVSRQFNKVTAKSDNTKLSKGQLQNAEHYKFDAFNEFYKQFLTDFQKDIGLSNAEFTNDIQKMVLISFKTIGDQMYLYDAALLATMPNPQAGGTILKGGVGVLDDIPTVVTGDTFLRDYIIYTKSADLICPTTVDKTPGKRKLKVYLKPRNTNPEQLAEAAAAAATAKAAAEAEKADKLQKTLDSLTENQAKLLSNPNYVNHETIMGAEFTKIIESIANFNKIVLGGNRIFRTLSIDNVPIKNYNVIACYYNILEKLLLRDEYNILMTELDVVNGVLNAEDLTQEQRINYLRTMNQYISRVNDILAITSELKVDVNVDFSPQYYDFNERLNFIKSAYPRGVSRKYLPYNIIKHYASNDLLIKRVFDMITSTDMRGGKPPPKPDDYYTKLRLGRYAKQSTGLRQSNIAQHRYDSDINEKLDYIATSFNAIEELVSLDGVIPDMDHYNTWFETMLQTYMNNDVQIQVTGNPVDDKILSLLDDIRYYLHLLGINLIEDQVYTLTDRYAEEIVDSKDIGMVMGDDVEDSASESNGKLHVIRPDDSDSDNDGPLPYVPGAASAMVEGDSDDEGPLPYVPGSASANVIEGSEYVPPNGIKKFKVPMNLYNIEKEKPPFNFQEYKKFEPPGSHFVFGNPQVPPPIRIEAGGDIIRKTKKPKYMKKNTKHTRKLKPKQTLKRRHPTKNKTKQNLKKQSRTMKKTRTQ